MEGRVYPTVSQLCGNECVVYNDSCLCTTNASSIVVYIDSKSIPSVDDVLTRLHIGAPDPAMYDNGTYAVAYEDLTKGLLIHVDSTKSFNAKTIFEVRMKGSRVRYLANIQAVEYEVDAVLKHLLYHQNTGTFVGKFLINRFVTSNPSSAYIETVAEAFQSGSYMGIGSGVYGDIASTIAAVLLYRESLSTSVKSDVSHGKFQEPLMKVIHLMRALEVVPKNNREITLTNLDGYLSQQPYTAPSVFNFFQSDFQPDGSFLHTQRIIWARIAALDLSPSDDLSEQYCQFHRIWCH
jgi:hypothetical protein